MYSKATLLTILLLLPAMLSAQMEVRSDTSNIPTGLLLPEEIEFLTRINLDAIKPMDIGNMAIGTLQDPVPLQVKIEIPRLYYQPMRKQGIANKQFSENYKDFDSWKLSKNLYLGASSGQNVYHSLGYIRTIDAGLFYKPTDWLLMRGGAYTANYNLHNTSYFDVGVNSSMKIFLGDRVRINMSGQYSVNGSSNLNNKGVPSGMFPGSYFGGTVEVRITDKFGIQCGVIREFDPRTRRWVNQYVVGPVFY